MNNAEEEFVEGNRATKIKFFALLGLGVVWWLGSRPLFEYITSQNETLSKTQPLEALSRDANLLLVMTVIFAVIFWGLAISFLKLGIRVIKSGQWPPPGKKVAFRAKIHRGKYATLTAIIFFLAAGGLLLDSLMHLYGWYTVHRLVSDFKAFDNGSPSGVPNMK